jgi:hypothetical protein
MDTKTTEDNIEDSKGVNRSHKSKKDR